jgi:hypothetical protein
MTLYPFTQFQIEYVKSMSTYNAKFTVLKGDVVVVVESISYWQNFVYLFELTWIEIGQFSAENSRSILKLIVAKVIGHLKSTKHEKVDSIFFSIKSERANAILTSIFTRTAKV